VKNTLFFYWSDSLLFIRVRFVYNALRSKWLFIFSPVVLTFCFLLLQATGRGQIFPPAAGQAGSTAFSKDSAVFKDWVVEAVVLRGWQDISMPQLGKVSAGEDQNCLGQALANGVVSLGDGGSAICTFNRLVFDGPGFDFAVFENSFDGLFLELAFVEVSSDGINFYRFPASSLSDTTLQAGTFANTDAKKINNLAGKYAAGFGTPFDLTELAGIPGLNINAITHIKVIDVVGSLFSAYCTRDAEGRKINDPWPTPFAQGGFDLDAIGVIHSSTVTSLSEHPITDPINVFPNPVRENELIQFSNEQAAHWSLINTGGETLRHGKGSELNIAGLPSGIYILSIPGLDFQKKIVIYSSR